MVGPFLKPGKKTTVTIFELLNVNYFEIKNLFAAYHFRPGILDFFLPEK